MFDFILPFRLDQTIHLPRRRKIGSRTSVIIVKQTGDRCAPVVNKRYASGLFSKIPDSDIEDLRVVVPVILKIYPTKKGDSSIR